MRSSERRSSWSKRSHGGGVSGTGRRQASRHAVLQASASFRAQRLANAASSFSDMSKILYRLVP